MEKEKLSVFVITKNEEEKIEQCLKHLVWADEIVVVDSNSTDKTEAIVKKYTTKVFKKEFQGYGSQKQYAIEKCNNEWILEVDADEIVPEALKLEIEALLENKETLNMHAAYHITRKEYFLQKSLMTTKIVRFYKKSVVHYENEIHEVLKVNGTVGKLKNCLEHEADKYDSIAKRVEKNNEYTKREAAMVWKKGTWNVFQICLRMITMPLLYGLWLGIGKGLFFKGKRGLIWCILTMHYHFLVYAKMYEILYKEKTAPEEQNEKAQD